MADTICPIGFGDCEDCAHSDTSDGTCKLLGEVIFNKTGLTMPDDISFESFKKWEAIGKKLKETAKSIHFWLGDWLLEGARIFGEMYSQAIDETGFDQKILRNDLSVCSRVEKSIRKDSLSFSHHKQVANFKPKLQEFFLTIAEKEGLSNDELRKAIKNFKVLKKGFLND